MTKSPDFLGHKEGDFVAVAVRDVDPGGGLLVEFLDGSDSVSIEVSDHIPLGHKVALVDIAQGKELIEYSLPVAVTTKSIAKGDYVHTHNVRSARWQTSVA